MTVMEDSVLKKSVEDELKWEPSLNAAHIGVAVENGVVTLTGHVETYAEKIRAEDATKRVRGVRGLAQEIEVRPKDSDSNADDEIAKRAVNLLAWNVNVPDSVQVKVQKGWVTLTGKVKWQFERKAAENGIRNLGGVLGVNNFIAVQQEVNVSDVKRRIEDALKRHAQIEADHIRVESKNGEVTLEGKVQSLQERDALEQAVWAVPGVRSIIDRVRIG
jgi:osmotically-inducible protein OsmY